MKWKLIVEQHIDDDAEFQLADLDGLMLNIVDDDLAEEGLGKLISFGLFAMVLGSSGIVEGAELRKGMADLVKSKQVQQGKPVTVTKSEIKDVIEQAKKPDEKVGNWKKDAAINVVARTLYMEARGEGSIGMNMVMTVIWNRSGGDKEEFAPECLRYKQFSCWNKMPSSQKTPSGYVIKFPKGAFSGGEDQAAWLRCQDLAKSMFDGTFKPANSDWNAYYNPDKASPDWADQLIDAKTIGRHIVGKLKDVSQHAKNTQKAKAKKQVTT